MVIYSTTSGKLQIFTEERLYCDGAFIDEVGGFVQMLDETKTKVNIYAIEWEYDVDKPQPRFGRSTIESLDRETDGEDHLPVQRTVGDPMKQRRQVSARAMILKERKKLLI